jgi:hypothetical protein
MESGLASAQAQQPAQAQEQGKPTKDATKKRRPLTPGQRAARERQKKCGAEWKAAKSAGKVDPKMKWPQFWSACNKRLKAQGT